MTDLDVRRFEAGDGPAVRDLHERALRDAGDFVEDTPEPDLQDVPGHYLDGEGEGDGTGEFLVGERADEIVAMVAYHPASEWILADRFSFDVETAELTRMRVDPDQQRRGFGERIYTELERRARDAGYDQLVLDVSEDNESARRFYEDQGFEYLETATLTAMDRTFRLAIYRKQLTGAGNDD